MLSIRKRASVGCRVVRNAILVGIVSFDGIRPMVPVIPPTFFLYEQRTVGSRSRTNLLHVVDGQSARHRDEHDEGKKQRFLEVPHISVAVLGLQLV